MINIASWLARQQFVVYDTLITTPVPYLNVLLTSANMHPNIFTYARSDGGDLRFTTDTLGVNELPSEVVFFDKVGKRAEIWVTVSGVQTSADTPFYCWFGNTSATAYASSATYGRNAVWNSTSAISVHHFHQTSAVNALLSGTLINSQGNSAYNANVSGSVYTSGITVPDDGRRGIRLYSTSAGRLVMNGNVIPYQTNRTVECVIRVATYGGGGKGTIISEESVSEDGHALTISDDGYDNSLRFKATSFDDARHTDVDSILTNTWYHVAVTYTSGSPSSIKMYINGVLSDSGSMSMQNGGANTTIGAMASSGTARNFDGWIDEMRVYNTVKTAYDLTLSNATQTNPPSIAMWVGEPEFGGGSTRALSGSSLTTSAGNVSNVLVDVVIPLESIVMQAYAGDVQYIDPSRYSSPVPKKRYRQNRKLNLVKFLPSIHRESETEQFTQFVQDFLNTLFDGSEGMTLSSVDLPVSGNYRLSGTSGDIVYSQYTSPNTLNQPQSTVNTDTIEVQDVTLVPPTDTTEKISIIEKIFRLTELKDPDLIDIENIQYFADNAGYNVDVYRDEFGNIDQEYPQRPIATSATSAEYNEQYLRFNISNMPEWYKIKTTDNAVQVLLFSFGLIGNVVKYFTNDYKSFNTSGSTGGNWVADINNDLKNIQDDYFSTPHFGMGILLDESDDLIVDTEKAISLIRAMKSIQPINTVFKRLAGYLIREYDIEVSMRVRKTRYIRVE